jgi:hypothetical protein
MALGLGALLAISAGCGNAEEEAQQQAAAAAAAAQQAAAQAAQQAQQAQQQAAGAAGAAGAPTGAPTFGVVTLAPGFMPDPHVAQGTSGGGRDASTVTAGCNGWIAQNPDHNFVASGAFTTLRIMARSESDTTLVIRKPDGTYACNDDSDGLNPLVQIDNAVAGTYNVWIGSYQQGQNAAYKLGFSELATTTPSSLPQ